MYYNYRIMTTVAFKLSHVDQFCFALLSTEVKVNAFQLNHQTVTYVTAKKITEEQSIKENTYHRQLRY